MRELPALAAAAASMFLACTPAEAHHSYAIFDHSRSVTIEGTVKDFQWSNPHGWILMSVTDAQGRLEQWAVQLSAPGALSRLGWGPGTLKSGMKITAVIHPLAHGDMLGGECMTVTLPDGRELHDVTGG